MVNMADNKKNNNDGSIRQRKKKDKKVGEPEEPAAGTTPPPNPYKKLITRMIMGSFMIAFFTLVLNSDHTVIAAFVIALQVLSFKEILGVRYKAAKEKQLPAFRTLNWAFLGITLFFVYGKPALLHLPFLQNFTVTVTRYHMLISFVLYCIGFVTFILTLQKDLYKYQFGQFTWTLMTLLMVVVQSNFIIKNLFEGIIWVLLPIAIIVCNDIFAYFSGFFFGRKFIKRPFISLSPNKTWEGFIGATFWTILFACVFADFLADKQWFICPRVDDNWFKPLSCTPQPVFLPITYHLPAAIVSVIGRATVTVKPIVLHAVVMGIFGSLIAPFGGFFASAIKRAYNKKDFDNIFPGHGGFTDRTDCQYITGLFVYVYYQMFIKQSSFLDLESVIDQALALSLDEQILLLNRLNETIIQSLQSAAA